MRRVLALLVVLVVGGPTFAVTACELLCAAHAATTTPAGCHEHAEMPSSSSALVDVAVACHTPAELPDAFVAWAFVVTAVPPATMLPAVALPMLSRQAWAPAPAARPPDLARQNLPLRI